MTDANSPQRTEGNHPERAPSETALGVARLRAVHQLRDGSPKILDDPAVLRLLDPETIERIRTVDLRDEPIGLRALRVHVVVRSRYTEDRLHEAMQRGVRQFVLLGAGLDTFAYRQPTWAEGLQVFEVDHAASQAVKRRLLAERKIEIPDNVRYVTADFEQPASLAAALAEAGFLIERPAVAACLGVLVYLTEPAINGLFDFCARLAEGSEFVFTIRPRGDDRGSRLAELAAAAGEPWRSPQNMDDVAPALRARGFGEVFQPTVEELINRYFQNRDDSLPLPRRSTLVVARR